MKALSVALFFAAFAAFTFVQFSLVVAIALQFSVFLLALVGFDYASMPRMHTPHGHRDLDVPDRKAGGNPD